MQFITSIPFNKLPFHSALVKEYLLENDFLKPFYTTSPSKEGLEDALSSKVYPKANRVVLSKVLSRQYQNLIIEGKVKSNIELLAEDSTFTITTGHQLCLYSGPAYFMYKIASAINLARQLSKSNPSKNIVPVFWMASEDHDFEEISEVHFYGKKWKWEKENDNFGKVPVGLLSPKQIAVWAAEMKSYFREEVHVSSLLDNFQTAYASHNNLSDATRAFLHGLFGNDGLVIIDGNDPDLKALMKPLLIKEVKESVSHIALTETTLELEKLNFQGQIVSRDINLFYLNNHNIRERIERLNDGFILHSSGFFFTAEALENEIQQYPERFSPNVVLRPVYQEIILPNLAYIGGPAEVAYWLQLKSVFASFNVPYPAVLVRSSFAIIPAGLDEKVAKHGFSIFDFLTKDLAGIVATFMHETHGDELNFELENETITALVDLLKIKVNQIDKQLETQVKVEEKNIRDILHRLQQKFNKALKMKSEADVKVIQRLKGILFPENHFQERYINICDTFDFTAFSLEELILHADPLALQLKVFSK